MLQITGDTRDETSDIPGRAKILLWSGFFFWPREFGQTLTIE